MEMRKLGDHGPEVSVVGFGAWEAGGDFWGPNESDERVIAAVRAAMDAGMSWIDTAEVYGDGRSEELVGRALEGHRDQALIFTKVAPRPGGTGIRPEQVREALQRSIKRLGVDHVDLYQVHWPDRSVPIEETWAAVAELISDGLTRHVGVSNFDRSLIERCLAIHHVDSVQNKLSLLHPEDRGDLLPWLREAGVGYLAYSPLGLGLLTGAITADTAFHPGDFRGGGQGARPADFRPANLRRTIGRVERLRPIAARLGTSVGGLSLRWVLEQPGVTAAIAGSRNPEHVRSNATVGDLRLDPETLTEIDTIFRIDNSRR
jgi:aryl-alcohol dehydrogenase-like predicted oxidoreductase